MAGSIIHLRHLSSFWGVAQQALIGLSIQFEWRWFPKEFIKNNPLLFLFIFPLIVSIVITILRIFLTTELKIGSLSTEPIKIKSNKNYIIRFILISGNFREIHINQDVIRIKALEILKRMFKFHDFSEEELYGAHIGIDVGGGLAFGGSSAIDMGTNKYLLPETRPDDMYLEDKSVFYFYANKDEYFMLRLFTENINSEKKEILFNVFISSSSKITSIN